MRSVVPRSSFSQLVRVSFEGLSQVLLLK